MQGLRLCMQRLSLSCRAITEPSAVLFNGCRITAVGSFLSFHTSNQLGHYGGHVHNRWSNHNKTIFPVQAPGEERRPAYVCHQKLNIKYSPKKMWYIACLVRGMSVDEAVKQLNFVLKKGGTAVKETILEAQQLAVEQHNVEFKSNLWVAESFTTKGHVIKGVRRHAKKRIGQVRYMHCHYYVRLEEGKPPKNYYHPIPQSPEEQLQTWHDNLRKRKIANSL
ncbi:39S ribosomal protein L22, mitochondrial [Orussus abietinus]|uniref:39S ribosomal protein L22, mitochondrial n=1 Tax=Orussus abietinus TaxID=222816 RepID=UPI000626C379|nr:39S ribosomal protein L22, mitochondrial [Orussus abietinus]XP_023288138.1 39S ribosomal protein L22, mitochondrial [Orussus abietinus]